MTENTKLTIKSLSSIISQIEKVCSRGDNNKEESIKLVNNLRIVLEKNVIQQDNLKQYEIAEKREELRKIVYELSFYRRNLLKVYADEYEKHFNDILDFYILRLKKLKEEQENLNNNFLNDNIIVWESDNDLDYKNLNSQILSSFEKLKKCINILDDKLINEVQSTNIGGSINNTLSHCLSYFRNL